MNPRISVCMPNFNYARFLPEAIESVLGQTFRDFELIIIDNCSTDGSTDIIARYAAGDGRIRFSINESNVGPVNNLNRCLEKAQGEYIIVLMSDDRFASSRALEKLSSVLGDNPDAALVACSRQVINEHSQVTEILSEHPGGGRRSGTAVIQECLIEQKNLIGEPSAVMFRRRHALRGFDIRYRQAVDLEMWFHILEQGSFVYIDEPLCSFRQHESQETRKNVNERNGPLADEAFLLLDEYACKPYVRLSGLRRAYMFYVPVYAVWKRYKNNRITRRAALDGIRVRYGLARFILFYPWFKVMRSVMRASAPVRSRRPGRAGDRVHG